MSIELLLLEDVQNVGQSGQVIRVSEGFARNFLLPRRLAIPATQAVIAGAQRISQSRKAQLRKELEEFRGLAQKIESLECILSMKVGREDKLYGSVTNADIAEALQKLGVQIDRKRILLKEPIKALGTYTVSVKLHPEVEASLKVLVARQ